VRNEALGLREFFGSEVAYDEEDVDSQLTDFSKLCITIL
jgi:hypothetical protein